MKIIKIHYKVSKPVSSFKEIKKEGEVLKRFIVLGKFEGFYNKAFAVCHCQVSETPMAYFVVSPEVVKEGMFKDQYIINPKIEYALDNKGINDIGGKVKIISNTINSDEPCLSFPFRKPKRVLRHDVIFVSYQIPSLTGLKTIDVELKGVASIIFQHCCEMLSGKNIYFNSETPVKWWEAKGTATTNYQSEDDEVVDMLKNGYKLKYTKKLSKAKRKALKAKKEL